MRIDSNGALLVGKTNDLAATPGTYMGATGVVEMTTLSASVLRINRLTSDGAIVDFKKDGATVGSIGSYNGELVVSSPSGGDCAFRVGYNAIKPATVTGANADGVHNLGETSGRWRDLYLSGGVYLGGTAAANKLDDYEEGTWTPTFTANGGTQPTIVYGTRSGLYTKIGKLVTIQGFLALSSVSGVVSGIAQIGGLPFTMTSNLSDHAVGNFAGAGLDFSRPICPGLTRLTTSTVGFLSSQLDGSGWGWETVSIFTSGDQIRFSMTYMTDQ